MRIAFLTDLHIATPDKTPLGVDVRQNFQNALALATSLKPNCVVLGGDLCYQTGDRAVYAWIKEQLDALPCQWYTIAGNHDDVTLLAEELHLTHHVVDNELYYAVPLEGMPALFLDTSRERCSSKQFAWLREYLHALQDSNVLVFMHHPPVPAGVGHMDLNYPFRQSEEFLDLVRELPCHVTAICGHYHVEKTVLRGNLLVLLTPSLFFQMQHDPTDCVVDHYRPAVREINITSEGLTSAVHYL